MTLILEYASEADANLGLAVINEVAAQWWPTQGYTVEEVDGVKTLIGKNTQTGEDEPSKQRTTTWDIVKESPDGTWYISSPSNKAIFFDPDNGIDWRSGYNAAGGAVYTEKEFPTEWYLDE